MNAHGFWAERALTSYPVRQAGLRALLGSICLPTAMPRRQRGTHSQTRLRTPNCDSKHCCCVLSHLGRSPLAFSCETTCHKHLGHEGPNNIEAQRVANHCPKLAIADVPFATGVDVNRQRLESQPFWDR